FQSDGQGGLISGLLDANINGATSAAVSWQGGYTVNAIGRLTMNLTAPLAGTSGPLNFVGYIVSGKEIALIGSDSASTAHLLTGWAHVQSNTSCPSNLAMVAALNGVSGGGTSALAANLFGPSPAQAYVTQNVAGSSEIAVPANWSHNLRSQARGTPALQSSPSDPFV